MLSWPDIGKLCTECHVMKGPELAQVGFDPAALFDACEINREISIVKRCYLICMKNPILPNYLSFKYICLLPYETYVPCMQV